MVATARGRAGAAEGGGPLAMTTLLRTTIGALLRARSARHRAEQAAQPAGTLGAESSAWLASAYLMFAESIDGLDRWRRIYRLACMYPILWATAERYDDEHGERAGEMIEARLRGGREP